MENDNGTDALPNRFELLSSRGMNQKNEKRWIFIAIVAFAAASAAFFVFGSPPSN